MNVTNTIKSNLNNWAKKSGIEIDKDGYCLSLEDNLFQPLSPCTKCEFMLGDGKELGKNGQRGKMQAIHSSSALACNIFDYWRNSNLGFLVKLFQLSSQITKLSFEQKFKTGLDGRAPNLDVVLYQTNGSLFAIESKFIEPYQKKPNNTLRQSYFPTDKHLWEAVGLKGCQKIANDLLSGNLRFKYLHVAQLLKHMLGLACNGKSWVLCYLWFCPECKESIGHKKEIDRFIQHLDSDYFIAITYQDLFDRMFNILSREHALYVKYLKERYFS